MQTPNMNALLTAVQTELTTTSTEVRCDEDLMTKSFEDETNVLMTGSNDNFDDSDDASRNPTHKISVITATKNDIEKDKENEKDEKDKRKPYGGRPLRFQCPTCDRRFHAPSHLKRHMLCHSTERPFQCHICQKGFLQAWHLGRHMTTHTGNKPFSCPECPKTFGSRFEMKTHCNYIHKGIKEHECNVCKKMFTLRSNLKVHMRKHTGEKPYECTICDKRFGQRGHLQYHLRKHTMNPSDQKNDNSIKEGKSLSSSFKPTLIDNSSPAPSNLSYDSGVEISDNEKSNSRPVSPTFLSDKQKEMSVSLQYMDVKKAPNLLGSSSSFVKRNEITTIPLSGRIYDHTNPKEIKPYVCESCNCGFAEINSLRAHARHSHPKKGLYNGVYSCAYCNRAFNDIEYLRQHFYYDHTMKSTQNDDAYQVRKLGQKYKGCSDNKYFIVKKPSIDESKSRMLYRPSSVRSTSSDSSSDSIVGYHQSKSPSSYSISSDCSLDQHPTLLKTYPECGPKCHCKKSYFQDEELAAIIEKRYMYHLEQYQKFLHSHVSLMEALKYKKRAIES